MIRFASMRIGYHPWRGSAFEEAHELEVMGVGLEVKWFDARDAPTAHRQVCSVTRPGGHLARHVGKRSRVSRVECVPQFLARPARVGSTHDDIRG
jgi:hypothetical protein